MVTLPNELWVPILGHLRLPVPAPRSRVPRSGLGKQPDLCSCARVCKLFAEIAQRLIYLHIATDQLELIIPPTSADFPSRRHLLSHTRSLFVEYRGKQEQPPYSQLLREKGVWKSIGMDQKAMDLITLSTCEEEIKALEAALEVVLEVGPSREMFPNLKTLVLGSIYGEDIGIWRRYFDTPSDRNPPSTRGGQALEYFRMFCHTSNLEHLCSRLLLGPLKTPARSFYHPHESANGPAFSWTTHIPDTSDVVILSMPYNTPVVWLSDAARPRSWADMVQVLQDSFRAAIRQRTRAEAIKWKPTDTLDMVLYCTLYCTVSYDEPLSPSDASLLAHIDTLPPSPLVTNGPRLHERYRTFYIGEQMQEQLKKDMGIDVRFRWFPSDMAPPCLACRSLPLD